MRALRNGIWNLTFRARVFPHGGRVPPHPDPLPEEREQPAKFLSHPIAHPANPVAGNLKTLEPILLLPKGEGRDEGEGDHEPTKLIFALTANIHVRVFCVVRGCGVILPRAALSKLPENLPATALQRSSLFAGGDGQRSVRAHAASRGARCNR
jgi:hypothetical protein